EIKPLTIKPPTVVENQVHFDFYTDLPNMRIKIEKLKQAQSISSDKKNLPKKPGETSYILQIGVFKTENEANQHRVTLLLSGIEVQMIQTEEGYQLQKGPYSNLKEVQRLQKKLQTNEVSSVIIRD